MDQRSLKACEVKYAMSQCVVKATKYSKLPENKYLLAYSAIIFDQNMTVFSSTQLIFLFDPKGQRPGREKGLSANFIKKNCINFPCLRTIKEGL